MAYPYIKCYARSGDEEKLIGMRFLKRNETMTEAENSYKKMFPNYELTFDYGYAHVRIENYSHFICR